MTSYEAPYGPARHYTSTHLFFYGYELQLPEACLQQWYPSSFTDPISGHRFPTCEHWQMYQKAILFEGADSDSAKAVLAASTPGEANKLGRGVKGYNKKLWEEKREGVVEQGNYLKFSQSEECRRALLKTGELVLVEGSPVDRVWGIGFRGDEAEGKEEEWGLSLLGKALMRVRERLRKEGYRDDSGKS